MNRITFPLLVALTCVAVTAGNPDSRTMAAVAEEMPSAHEVIEAAIRYHDPKGQWFTSENSLVIGQTRPGGHSKKTVSLTLFSTSDRFRMTSEKDGYRVSGEFDGDDCTLDPPTLSPEEAERFQEFTCDGLRWWLTYYGYLFNCPMNLRDEGGDLEPLVVKEPLEGRDAYRIRIGYGEGQPLWEYFVDPVSYRLLGCRFSTKGERKDGELITYEDEIESNGIRLPRKRSWYFHKNGELIGIDEIENFESKPAS